MNAVAAILFSPTREANRQILNHLNLANLCALELNDIGLHLTGRIELDADAPIVWVEPPQDPLRLFGRYARVNSDHNRAPRRCGSVYYHHCHVRWEIRHD